MVLLQQRFKLLNKEIQTFYRNTSLKQNFSISFSEAKENYIKIRVLHLELCKVGKKIGKYFSMQIVIIIALTFFDLMNYSHYAYHVMGNVVFDGKQYNFNFFITICAVFAKFVDIFVVSLICTWTKNEVVI